MECLEKDGVVLSPLDLFKESSTDFERAAAVTNTPTVKLDL